MCAPPSRSWAARTARDPSYPEKRAAIARRRQQAIRDFLTAYKRERGCIDCGHPGHESGCDLDLDHMDGKTHSIPHSTSIAAALAEIERHNCVVRCANCHRIKTWKERQQ